MSLLKIFTLLFLLFPLALYAESPPNFPPALRYHNKSLEAICFEPNSQDTDYYVSLDKCNNTANIKKGKVNTYLTGKGFIGYAYREKTENANGAVFSDIYYKIIGQYQETFIIQTIESGGGTGVFEHLLLVLPQGKQLKINTLTGCDRCDINNVQLKNSLLTYTKQITPADLVSIIDEKLSHSSHSPEDILDMCAVCGVFKAKYIIDLNQIDVNAKTVEIKPTLETIDLGKDLQWATNDPKRPYQNCFNQTVLNYQKRDHHFLDSKILSQFVNDFKKSCV